MKKYNICANCVHKDTCDGLDCYSQNMRDACAEPKELNFDREEK